MRHSSPLITFCGPPLIPLQQVHILLMLENPELDAALQLGSQERRGEGKEHLPHPASLATFDAAQDMTGFLGWKHIVNSYWASYQPTPMSPSSLAFSQTILCQLYLSLELLQPRCSTLHFALFNFMKLTWAHLWSLSRSIQMSSFLSTMSTRLRILVSSANLHSIPLSVLLKKILNSIGPNTDPWGTMTSNCMELWKGEELWMYSQSHVLSYTEWTQIS